ncbi:hypothetical protein [Flavobacterium sp.]|uniref:hypothetical protein n=1 Tax=Flavobacterium sp. TaxID=239 RepID=UPI002624DB3E|nr:hypothetical protein [Flavobacterium sp.]
MKYLKDCSHWLWDMSGFFAVIGMITLLAWPMAKLALYDQKTAELQVGLNEKTSETITGKFAVENYLSCTEVSGRPGAECVNQIKTAALNLKGVAFSEAVITEMSDWFDKSNHLQSSRNQGRLKLKENWF